MAAPPSLDVRNRRFRRRPPAVALFGGGGPCLDQVRRVDVNESGQWTVGQWLVGPDAICSDSAGQVAVSSDRRGGRVIRRPVMTVAVCRGFGRSPVIPRPGPGKPIGRGAEYCDAGSVDAARCLFLFLNPEPRTLSPIVAEAVPEPFHGIAAIQLKSTGASSLIGIRGEAPVLCPAIDVLAVHVDAYRELRRPLLSQDDAIAQEGRHKDIVRRDFVNQPLGHASSVFSTRPSHPLQSRRIRRPCQEAATRHYPLTTLPPALACGGQVADNRSG
jgi:hypothetical protein